MASPVILWLVRSMIKAFAENDLVILDLCGRRRDVLLSCGTAADLAQRVRELADEAEAADSTIFVGRIWDVKVESFDTAIALRFTPPWQSQGDPWRVPMRAGAARRFADLIDSKVSFAQYGMRLVLGTAPNSHYSPIYDVPIHHGVS